MHGKEEDAVYYARRAAEEKMKVKQAVGRGDHPAAVAAHGELALRYQLRAFAPTYHVREEQGPSSDRRRSRDAMMPSKPRNHPVVTSEHPGLPIGNR